MRSRQVLQRDACLVVFAVFLFMSAAPANAQYEITYEKPFVARSLSGIVVDPTGTPVVAVLVEECDSELDQRQSYDSSGKPVGLFPSPKCSTEPNHVVASMRTDAQGRFAFPGAKSGRTCYLHLRLYGFNPMIIPIKVGFFARRGVKIHLQIAA